MHPRNCYPGRIQFLDALLQKAAWMRDATADYSDEEMHAALDVNIPNYASAVVTTEEIVGAISARSASRHHEAVIR
jgi:ureidoacrylate peracid hydrolase